MTKMIKLKTNGNETARKWLHNPYLLGTVTAAAITLGAASLRTCGPKPAAPECEQCCPPNHRKEVSKQPYGVMIKCIDPLTEPRCGDNKCNGDETPKSCPQDCPPVCGDGEITHSEPCDTKSGLKNNGCKDEKTQCKSADDGCACVVRVVREEPAPKPAPQAKPAPAPEPEPEEAPQPKASKCGPDKIESQSASEAKRYYEAVNDGILEWKDRIVGGSTVNGKRIPGKATYCKSGKIYVILPDTIGSELQGSMKKSITAKMAEIGPRDQNFEFLFSIDVRSE